MSLFNELLLIFSDTMPRIRLMMLEGWFELARVDVDCSAVGA